MQSSDANYDGCVLEVSSPNINGGAYTDVTDPAVGGSFATGGSTSHHWRRTTMNPIGGREGLGFHLGRLCRARWSISEPNVRCHTIKLRFRMGTDQAPRRSRMAY